MKKLSTISILILLFVIGHAQTKNNEASSIESFGQYNRATFGWVYIDQNDQKFSGYCGEKFQSVDLGIPDKYDQIDIESRVIKGSTIDKEIDLLTKNKVPNRFISSLFEGDNGKWSMEKFVLKSRNAMSDADYIEFEKSFRSIDESAQEKLVYPLLKSSYLITSKLIGIKSMTQVYDEQDASAREYAKKYNKEFTPVERALKGYIGSFSHKIFHIQINDSIAALIFSDMWADANSTPAQIETAINNRNNMVYSLKYETEISSNEYGTVPVNEPNLSDRGYCENMMENISFDWESVEENVEALQVKASVFEVNPIQSKIGKKENLIVDQRFRVFELVQKKNGEYQKIRRGVVRTKRVGNNKGEAKGNAETSAFYQVEGQKIDKGMMVQEYKDIATLYVGYGTHGIYTKLDFFCSDFIFPENFQKKHMIHAVKFYGDLNIDHLNFKDHEEINWNGKETKSSVMLIGLGIGVSKEYYFMRNFYVGPYFGYQFETAKFSDTDLNKALEDGKITINGTKTDASYGNAGHSFNIGANFGVTIYHNFKINAHLGYSPISYDKNLVFGKDSILHIKRSPIKANLTIRYDIGWGKMFGTKKKEVLN